LKRSDAAIAGLRFRSIFALVVNPATSIEKRLPRLNPNPAEECHCPRENRAPPRNSMAPNRRSMPPWKLVFWNPLQISATSVQAPR